MNEMRLIDTHAHLEQVERVAEALERARSSCVVGIVAVGMDLASNRRTLELAAQYPNFVFPALGIHPWAIDATELDKTMDYIRANIDTCVAVGEIGLDYSIKQDKTLQKEIFRELLDVAKEHNKPVSTHSKGSFEDVFNMVKDSGIEDAVFHWYSGPLDITRNIVSCGYHVSATLAVEYSEPHRDVIESVPLQSLLLETDCPIKYKGVKLEPASVNVTVREVARLKGEDPGRVASVTTRNAIELFKLRPAG